MTRHIISMGDYDVEKVNTIGDRFENITIGHLPHAIQAGLIDDEEFTIAAILVTVSVAMAFFANVHPDERNGLIDSFLQAFGQSIRVSMQTQNMFDMDVKGKA